VEKGSIILKDRERKVLLAVVTMTYPMHTSTRAPDRYTDI